MGTIRYLLAIAWFFSAALSHPQCAQCANVSTDWLASASQSNSATDEWQFFWNIDPSDRDGNYSLLPFYDTDWAGLGLGWELWTTADNSFPFVGKNLSGSDSNYVSPANNIHVPKDAVIMVPTGTGPVGVGIGYLVPISGTYRITGSVTDADTFGGDSVQWFLDRNAGNLVQGQLASGNIGLGGSESFSLTSVSLSQGDVVYLILDSKVNWNNDLTAVEFEVTLVPEPSGVVLVGIALCLYPLVRRGRTTPWNLSWQLGSHI